MKSGFIRLLNSGLELIGYKLIRHKNDLLVYMHDYKSGGYSKYRELQIFHNKRKLDQVWADEGTLKVITSYLRDNGTACHEGLCHGSRNGWEVNKLAELLSCPVIGTDISETANDFPNMVQWDFHEPNPDWVHRFSFIYTNSLDQAFDPRKALDAWADQLSDDGMIFIEHTMAHSAAGASEMDPFGAHPMVMPYLLFEWGRGKYRLRDILHPEHQKRGNSIWVFVLERIKA